jgi:hypothetical protein
MADYYSLIQRAVAGLEEPTPENRRAIYERAMAALKMQLENLDPPLSPAEIMREQILLEETVQRVELEATRVSDERIEEITNSQPIVAALDAQPSDEDVPQVSAPALPILADGLRPVVTAPKARRVDALRVAVVGVAVAIVVAATAIAAFMLRDTPADFERTQIATDADGEPQGKFQDRLPAIGVKAEASAPASAPIAQARPALPLGARAILVLEPEDPRQQPVVTQGRTVWKLDSVSGGPGQPIDTGVRGTSEFGESGLTLDLMFRRNRDAALPVSHTLELKFAHTDKAQVGSVRDISLPEMRANETQIGTPMAGIAVPVRDNLFLIGLSNLPSDVTRNFELLTSRGWIAFQTRFVDGRRALLLIEKGAIGDRVIADAQMAWK